MISVYTIIKTKLPCFLVLFFITHLKWPLAMKGRGGSLAWDPVGLKISSKVEQIWYNCSSSFTFRHVLVQMCSTYFMPQSVTVWLWKRFYCNSKCSLVRRSIGAGDISSIPLRFRTKQKLGSGSSELLLAKCTVRFRLFCFLRSGRVLLSVQDVGIKTQAK